MNDCPFNVENLHFYKALVYRKEEKFEKARLELQIACDEKDKDAIEFMYITKQYGGIGFQSEASDYYITRYLTESDLNIKIKEKSPLAIYYIYNNWYKRGNVLLVENRAYIEHCAIWKDTFALFIVNNFKSCAEQLFYYGIRKLIDENYLNLKYVDAASWIVRLPKKDMIYHSMSSALKHHVAVDGLKQQFIFGKWINEQSFANAREYPFSVCFDVYRETVSKTKSAIYCWMMICKRNGLYYDLAYLIGRMIWESQNEPELWINKNKKQKKIN